MEQVSIVLEDGSVFTGKRFGASYDAVGEIVFTTGMGGYIETLTDPSYYGQIAVQTFPLIGNYGWIPQDAESGNCSMKAYVVREYCDAPSNFRCEGTLDAYLKQQGIPGVYGVDTRALTKRIREHGTMNAVITGSPETAGESWKQYAIRDALRQVSCKAPYLVGNGAFQIALLDYGTKKSIAERLAARGCTVTVFPFDTPAETILNGGFDGVMLSNGPGDPSDNVAAIGQIQKLLGNIPIFGICLGHQMLALAAGAKTFKLKYGHRGVNQPVKDLFTGKITITSQNHGYAVDNETLPAGAKLRFINVNDGTCEGVEYPQLHAFSVQYHPEASAGPLDSVGLFDECIRRMKEAN